MKIKKESKIKTYVLTVSRFFPKTHKRLGERTWFIEKINEAIMPISDKAILGHKIHTIRGNYDLWQKRADEINKGKAILSIRYWSGKPYNSKQVEVLKIEKIGIEKIENFNNFVFAEIGSQKINWQMIAENDGLAFNDFLDWFKLEFSEKSNKPKVIIHFTDYRYGAK
jgi:hypothetical protein